MRIFNQNFLIKCIEEVSFQTPNRPSITILFSQKQLNLLSNGISHFILSHFFFFFWYIKLIKNHQRIIYFYLMSFVSINFEHVWYNLTYLENNSKNKNIKLIDIYNIILIKSRLHCIRLRYEQYNKIVNKKKLFSVIETFQL